ncbi:primosomal replication protein PriC [Photobacterium nomapromontoriensis]|uniref:primosomal replication protein PriC n=1 Tax=Photobacterium nomapromontoriensis TaxID=2910237 RepID=UPI003D126C7E
MPDLKRLEAIVSQLAHEAASTDRKRGEASRPLFDEQLFRSRSKLLMPCVNEIRHEISALINEQLAGKLQLTRTQHLCEKIVAQIQAIQRELATQAIRKNEPKRSQSWGKPIHQLHQDLTQHQEWERRLSAMQKDKSLMLGRCTTLDEQRRIQQEILALEGRLARCQQARKKIEHDINIQERKG